MKLHEMYFMLREYEESSFFAICHQIQCPHKQAMCFKVARLLCRNNKVCQQAIDRELDVLAMKHQFPNEEPGDFYPGGMSEAATKRMKAIIFTWKKPGTPAQAMAKVYRQLRNKHGKNMSFKTYYYENTPEKFKEFGIKAIPTLLLINAAGKREELKGVYPLDAIEKKMGV
jgi:hypothetical protein